jgi:hypothetical protein
MKVWITKHALTRWVFDAEAVEYPDAPIKGHTIIIVGSPLWEKVYHKPDWHTSEEDARLDVIRRCQEKLVGLHQEMTEVKKIMDKHQ